MSQRHANTLRSRSGMRSFRRPAYTLIELMIVLSIVATIAGISWPALMRPWSRSLTQQAAQQLSGELLEARIRAVEESRVYRIRWRPGTGEFQIDAPFADASPGDNPPGGTMDASQRPVDDSQAASRDDPTATPDTGRLELAQAREAQRPSGTASDPQGRVPGPLGPPTLPRPAAYHVATRLDNGVRFPSLQATPLDTNQASLPTSAPPGVASGELTSSAAAVSASLESAVMAPVEWSEPIWFYPDGRTSNGRWTLVSDEGYEVDVVLRGLTGTVRIGPVRAAPPDESPDAIAPDEGSPDGMSRDPLTETSSNST